MLAGEAVLAIAAWAVVSFLSRRVAAPVDRRGQAYWRMPPLAALSPPTMTRATKAWMGVLRGYLVLAAGLVLVRIVELALTGHA